MHPRDPPGRARKLPDLRHGAGTRDGLRRERPESGTRRHDAPVLGRAGAGGAGDGARDGRSPDQSAHAAGQGDVELAAVRSRHARRAVGRLALLRARLAVAQDAQSQHVHPDRHGHRRCLGLQRRGRRPARSLPAGLPRTRRGGGGLFRGGGGDHRPRAAGPDARVARARTDLGRDPRAARPGAEDGAAAQGRWHGRGGFARRRRGRRPAARPSGREGTGRRRGGRRPLVARRVDGHRRVDAGHQGARRQGDRRNDEHDRRPRHARREGRPRHHARPHRPDGRRGAALARADPAARRPGLGLFRSYRHRHCDRSLRGLGRLRS